MNATAEEIQETPQSGEGLGWGYDHDTRTAEYFFELEGAATDEDGNDAPAGVRIRLNQCANYISPAARAEYVSGIEADGLHGFPAKAITREHYETEYADND